MSSWTINQPISLKPPPELASITSGLENLGTNVGVILELAKGLLDAAKLFYFIAADPYKALVAALITEIEELINDLFGAGVYSLIVDPFTMVMHGKTKDRWGIPLVTPGDAINATLASLEDEADDNRPIFSPSANIAAFGLMITTPSYGELYDLLLRLYDLLKYDPILFLTQKLDKFKNGRPERSRLPDWDSVKLSNIGWFSDIQKSLLETISMIKGYIVVTDEMIVKLLDAITKKLQDIQDVVDILNLLILNIEALAGFNQAVVFDMPKGPGGIERLKAELYDQDLMSNRLNQYTFMFLLVGGGPGADTAEIFRSLLTI